MPLPIRSRPLDRPSPLPTRSIAAQPARRREIPRAPQVLVPLHYEPDYRYPLIVWVDDDPTAPVPLMRAASGISLRNHAGVAPAGRSHAIARPLAPCDTLDPAARFVAAVEAARRRLSIHPERIFIVGRGPSLAQLLAEIPLDGDASPAGVAWVADSITSCDPGRLGWNRRLDLPLLLAVPEPTLDERADLRSRLLALHAAGCDATTITSSRRPNFLTNALANVNRWVMSFITGEPAFPQAPIERIDMN